MIRLRASKFGFTLGATFLLAAGAMFAIHWHSLTTNAADAGERALYFFLFTLPWAYLLPEWVVSANWWSDSSYVVGWILVGFNAFLLYCFGGGVGLRRRATKDHQGARRNAKRDPHAVRDG